MNACEKLIQLCQQALKDKNLNTKEYNKRLKWEIKELQVKNDCEYFLNINKKNLPNKKNILVAYLLDICNEFDINKLPNFIGTEMPDIDCDFPPEIQQYLKNEWIPKEFGREYVCNIGSHNTLKLKSALLDCARIYGKDRDEILKITKNITDTDDENQPLSFEDAVELNPNLKKYLTDNPEINEAASKLTGKIRSHGQHAAGIIISSVPLSNLVPLIAGTEGKPCSVWGEGQNSLDLSTVGLIKFDVLGSESLNKIATCLRLIKERHGIEKICAIPGGENWSDTSYLDDPKCLEMASKGDLKTIFQFDSDTARNMCKNGGVNSFNDLVAYTSLNRPGCLEMGTDKQYVRRNKGEPYEIHPLLIPILKNTYGVILYQEQIVRVLSTVGMLPEQSCLEIQKAISKKKIEKFLKYKNIFIQNGQKVLSQSKQELEQLWALIESMSKYSFNLAHGVSYTYVSSRMLYLKAYYPVEWYAAVLSSMNSGDPRIQEYRYDGIKHGIKFNKPDINKSKTMFHIGEDNSIYYALSKIKSLPNAAVEKIVKLQPFKNFSDFLDRMDPGETAIKPIVALRMFSDDSPEKLYTYYKLGRAYRFENGKKQENIIKYKTQFMEILPVGFHGTVNMENVTTLEPILDKKIYKKLANISNRWAKSIETCNKKINDLENKEVNIESKYLQLLENPISAETEYFGFEWMNPLGSVGAEYTFEQFDTNQIESGPCDIRILSIEERQGKVKFYQITAEDLIGNKRKINIWMSDYNIWGDLFVVGAMLRMRLKAPDQGFPTYSLDGGRYTKWRRNINDFRVMILGGEGTK